jgi:hypothetical protein
VTTPTVQITSPGATATGPVTVNATFTNGGTPQYMKLWVDGVSKDVVFKTNTLKCTLTLSKAKHRITVQAYTGTMYSAVEYVTVQ